MTMDGELGWAALRMLGGLVGVVVLLGGLVVLVRRLGLAPRGRRAGQLELVDALALGPRKQVVVVRFLDELLALGVSDTGITLLTRRPMEEPSHDAFAHHLRAAAGSDPDGPDPGPGPGR